MKMMKLFALLFVFGLFVASPALAHEGVATQNEGAPSQPAVSKAVAQNDTPAKVSKLAKFVGKLGLTTKGDKEQSSAVDKIVLIILALFIPPLAVYLKYNAINTDFWIDLILWFVGFGILGIIYALYVILAK